MNAGGGFQQAAGAMVTPSVRLIRQLGAGGMGSVWLADHLGLRAQVGVKFMSKELASDTASVERFSREAAASSNVKSPHVVQVFDHGVSAKGDPFIVMELLEGQDLGHRIAAQAVLPLVEVDAIISQVCKALARAHEKGIVHRDIKPDNIFICHVGGDETDHSRGARSRGWLVDHGAGPPPNAQPNEPGRSRRSARRAARHSSVTQPVGERSAAGTERCVFGRAQIRFSQSTRGRWSATANAEDHGAPRSIGSCEEHPEIR